MQKGAKGTKLAKAPEPNFFATPAKLRAWLAKHHATERELLVGLWKVGSGKPSITWPQLVEELLCFGWIDGVRRSLGDEAYTIRVTPRRPRSIWSDVNLRLIEKLRAEGRLTPAGEAAFGARTDERSRIYAFEQETVAFSDEYATRFRRHKAAWAFFQTQAPSYRKVATHYVMSAKKVETREKRLANVIESSARGERIRESLPPKKRD